jgi:hypothetical protein
VTQAARLAFVASIIGGMACKVSLGSDSAPCAVPTHALHWATLTAA